MHDNYTATNTVTVHMATTINFFSIYLCNCYRFHSTMTPALLRVHPLLLNWQHQRNIMLTTNR